MGVTVRERLTLSTSPAIVLSSSACGGNSHLFNLIDGLNELVIDVSIVIALSLMAAAVLVGDYEISYILP